MGVGAGEAAVQEEESRRCIEGRTHRERKQKKTAARKCTGRETCTTARYASHAL
jgi:hypothetical protein